MIIQKDKRKEQETAISKEDIKKINELTDNELNYFPYLTAKLKDKRTFVQMYLSLIKSKQIIFIIFSCKNDFIPLTMKISFLFNTFSLFLVSNTLFLNDNVFHQIYESNGISNILEDLPMIFYATILASIIKNILFWVSFPDGDIVLIRGNILEEKINPFGIQNSISKVVIRCYLYFFIGILTLLLFLIYIGNFYNIFQNTQIYALKNALISLGISFVYPLILYLIPASIRNAALKCQGTQGGYCLYIIANIFQILL